MGQTTADILPVKGDLARSGVVQADDAAADGGFARAGLAHQTVGLAGVDLKTDIVHRLDREILIDAEYCFSPSTFSSGVVLCVAIYSASSIFFASAFMRAMRSLSSGGISTLGARGSSSHVAA